MGKKIKSIFNGSAMQNIVIILAILINLVGVAFNKHVLKNDTLFDSKVVLGIIVILTILFIECVKMNQKIYTIYNKNEYILHLCLYIGAVLLFFYLYNYIIDPIPSKEESDKFALKIFLSFLIMILGYFLSISDRYSVKVMKYIFLTMIISILFPELNSMLIYSIYSFLVLILILKGFVSLFVLIVEIISRKSFIPSRTETWYAKICFITFIITYYGIVLYALSDNIALISNIVITSLILLLLYNKKEANQDLKVFFNTYKPAIYKVFIKDDISDNFLFVDANIKYVDGYKMLKTSKNECEEDIDNTATLIQMDKSINKAKRKIEYIIHVDNGDKYGCTYKMKVHCSSTTIGDTYTDRIDLFRYRFIYAQGVKGYLMFSNFINKLNIKVILGKMKYLKLMLTNNVYYGNEMQKLQPKDAFNNFLYVNAPYGTGKTTFANAYVRSLKLNPDIYSYSQVKYDDIISEVGSGQIGKRRGGFVLIAIFITTIIASFLTIVASFIDNIDKTTVKNIKRFITDANYFEDAVKFLNLNEHGFGSRDFLLLAIITLIIVVIYYTYKNRLVFQLINFGSNKNADVLTSEISKMLVGNNRVLIVDDLDRKLDFEEIYKELTNISYFYKEKGESFAGILNISVDNIARKVGQYYYSRGITNLSCSPMSSKTINCSRCEHRKLCDFYQLMYKHYQKLEYNYEEIQKDYLNAIKDLDNELYNQCKGSKDFRELKRSAISYLDKLIEEGA